jgi:hypothetical protein
LLASSIAADTCATAATTIPLPIAFDPAVTVTSVTPTSDDVCPGANGTLTFAVTTFVDAATFGAALVTAAFPNSLVPGAACSATGSGKAWAVSCTGAPPGTYALSVTAKSALGERTL